MNPTKQIGRYKLPILDVMVVSPSAGMKAFLISLWLWVVRLARNLRYETSLRELRESLKSWPSPGYDVLLVNGHVIRFNEEEKRQYDAALELDTKVKQIWGACKSAGLRS